MANVGPKRLSSSGVGRRLIVHGGPSQLKASGYGVDIDRRCKIRECRGERLGSQRARACGAGRVGRLPRATVHHALSAPSMRMISDPRYSWNRIRDTRRLARLQLRQSGQPDARFVLTAEERKSEQVFRARTISRWIVPAAAGQMLVQRGPGDRTTSRCDRIQVVGGSATVPGKVRGSRTRRLGWEINHVDRGSGASASPQSDGYGMQGTWSSGRSYGRWTQANVTTGCVSRVQQESSPQRGLTAALEFISLHATLSPVSRVHVKSVSRIAVAFDYAVLPPAAEEGEYTYVTTRRSSSIACSRWQGRRIRYLIEPRSARNASRYGSKKIWRARDSASIETQAISEANETARGRA